MIEIKNVYKKYNGNNVIKNMNYKFKKGLYLITGSSGKGKTTLLNIIGGKDRKYKGEVAVNGSLLYFSDKGNLPSNLTVKEVFYLFEQINQIKIKEYFNVKDIINKKTNKLSLGELQLILLILVLNSNDEILVLDEPFSALSVSNLKKVSALLEQKAKNKLIIIATHNTQCFRKFTLLNLDKYKCKNIKEEVLNCRKKRVKPVPFGCYLLYLKKTIIRKVMLLITILATILNYFYINEYTKSMISNHLLDMEENSGVIIEKNNKIDEINEAVFYEVIKKVARYVHDYNVNYYNSNLYEQNIIINNNYIDNAFALSSIQYIEEPLLENEIIIGFDYNGFCRANNVVNCDENYLRVLLVNRKIKDYDYIVKNIFDNKETVILNNRRFNKIYEDNEHEEYYFDIKKEDEEYMFEVINKDDFLLNFDFIKVGENEDLIRYIVEDKNSSNFSYDNIEYSKYIVCLDGGYNCLDYLNHFSSLVSINDFKNISELDLEIIDKNLNLDEIVLSSNLAQKLDVEVDDVINFYFNYNEKIAEIPLIVKEIINSNKYLIYHNSYWSYSFFKEKLAFKNKDLMIKNIVIYDELKNGYKISENIYEEALKEVKSVLSETNRVIDIVNISVNLTSLLIVVLIELFYNKFKKEYFSFLRTINN